MRRLMKLLCAVMFCLAITGCENEVAEVPKTVAAQEVVATPRPTPTPTPTPTPPPTPTPEPEPEPIEMPDLGSSIDFAEIQWRVLDVYENYVLVISEYVLGHRQFHSTNADATWKSSDIRVYLNNEFLENFNESERGIIVKTEVTTDDNLWFGTPGGEDTLDMIFLLSLEEVVQLFGNSGQFEDRNHPANDVNFVDDEYTPSRHTVDLETGDDWWWWLRSPGDSQRVAVIGVCGRLGVRGTNATNRYGGIRPAMWIDFYLFYEYRHLKPE